MNFRNIPYYLMSLTVGIVFLISAYAKLDPVTTLIDNIHSRFTISYSFASYMAKALIGLEIALGLLFIMSIYGYKKWVLHISLYLLVIFSIFITYIWYAEGSEADCGCMGVLVKISPLWSIVKNIVLIVFVVALFYWKKICSKAQNYFAIIATVVLIFYPMVFFANNFPIEEVKQDTQDVSKIEIIKGKQMLIFATTGCPHCREAGKLLSKIKQEDPTIPITLIFPDKQLEKQSYLEDYMNDTKATNIPSYIMSSDLFRKIAGRGVPSIFIINNEVIIDKIDNYPALTTSKVQKLLR